MSGNGKETLDQNSRSAVESKSNRVDKIFEILNGTKPREAIDLLITALAVATIVGRDPNVSAEDAGRTVCEAFMAELSRRNQKLSSGPAH